jgi:hypothetical protein
MELWKTTRFGCSSRGTQKKLRNPCYQIGYCTEDISNGATLVYFCLQQHVLPSQSMRHTICVVNLMLQDTKIVFLNRSCLGPNLQLWGESLILYQCATYALYRLNIFGAKYLSSFILPTPFPISRADKSLSSNPSLKKISATHVIKLGYAPGQYKYCKW